MVWKFDVYDLRRVSKTSFECIVAADTTAKRLQTCLSVHLLLLGILEVDRGIAFRALTNVGLEFEKLKESIEALEKLMPGIGEDGTSGVTVANKMILHEAIQICNSIGMDEIEPHHLLAAILNLKDFELKTFELLDIDMKALTLELERLNNSSGQMDRP